MASVKRERSPSSPASPEEEFLKKYRSSSPRQDSTPITTPTIDVTTTSTSTTTFVDTTNTAASATAITPTIGTTNTSGISPAPIVRWNSIGRLGHVLGSFPDYNKIVTGFSFGNAYNPDPLQGIPIQDFYTERTNAYSNLALDYGIQCRRQMWKDELSEEAWVLLTDPALCIYDDEIMEVVGDHMNDIIPAGAWEVEKVWRESHFRHNRRGNVQSMETRDSSEDISLDHTEDEGSVYNIPLDGTEDEDSTDDVTSDDTEEEDLLHDIPINDFYKEETFGYPDELLDREIQWRRQSWKRVLPEETWSLLTDPAIDITDDNFVNMVGEHDSDSVNTDAWEVELAWRERDIRILRRDTEE